ncbi:YwhD family protein [Evansella caseinilytica]|uniref:YwhD family protein n=1 Tax=Evansella caseinilytica TaxID=1503961 RepID=A0A1H3T2H8_9BACI|nr:YwhD family protein [Evansella caseinilytica]SDZ44476.1 YwhD family protein [Evansella caseinilytica]
MDLFEKKKKEERRKQAFNILSADSTSGHGGYGAGVINLNNVTPVFVDVDEGEAFIDMGALHARSVVEKGIKFLPDKEQVPAGKPYWLVWITVDHKNGGPAYTGVTACELTVNRESRRGYKSLPEHVNNMDKSLKGRILVAHMDDKSKCVLREFLQDFNAEMWQHSDEQLKEALTV